MITWQNSYCQVRKLSLILLKYSEWKTVVVWIWNHISLLLLCKFSVSGHNYDTFFFCSLWCSHSNTCAYVCVFVFMCVCVCLSLSLYLCACVCYYMLVCPYAYMHNAFLCVCLCINAHVAPCWRMAAHMCTSMHVCVPLYVSFMYLYMWTSLHAYVRQRVCIFVWVCACMSIYQMCNRWGLAGDHARVLAQSAVWKRIDQWEQLLHRGLWQPVCHHLLCQLLHALCLSGEYSDRLKDSIW